MKNLNEVIFVLYLCIIYTKSQSFLSPCPRYFKYEFDGYDWVGIMAVPSPMLGHSLSVNVHLSIAAQLQTQYFGRLELLASRGEIVRDIIAGRPVKYKVRFPLPQPIPRLTGIVVNEQRICAGPPATGSVVTSIKLVHTLYTDSSPNSFVDPNTINNINVDPEIIFNNNPNSNVGFNTNNVFSNQNPNNFDTVNNWDNNNNGGIIFTPTQDVFSEFVITPTPTFERPRQPAVTRPPIQTRPSTRPTLQSSASVQLYTERPQIQSPSPTLPPRYQHENIITELSQNCGAIKALPNPLIIKGSVTKPGEWPWMAALYKVTDTGLAFKCGATLVSHKMVITAAHCIHEPDQSVTPKEKILLILGRFNINDWADNAVKATVERAIPHPDYFSHQIRTDADIAILLLKNRVEFTDVIKPLCLWSGSSDLDEVVGMDATVVGWGRDENGQKTTPEPRLAKIKVVSQQACVFSKEDFRHLISNRTFCAGSRNGIGPCNGDSGGGLLLPQNGHWALRGIVSISLLDPITNQCDVNEYTIFTDASKFHTWLIQYLVE